MAYCLSSPGTHLAFTDTVKVFPNLSRSLMVLASRASPARSLKTFPLRQSHSLQPLRPPHALNQL